jgi:PIN domain nuclease of toxin-antitoxin system
VTSRRHHLLDASALLAVILNEPGGDRVEAVLDDSLVLGINVAEAARKLFVKGMSPNDVAEILLALHLDTDEQDFSVQQAICVGAAAAANRKIGLSIGDAACLAMGAWRELKVVTADRTWTACEWPDLQGFDKAPEVVTIR